MGGSTAFADILDEKVSGFERSQGVPDPSFQPRYIPPHPLLFATPSQPFRPSPYRAVPRHRTTYHQRPSAPPEPEAKPFRPVSTPVRPARTLTRRQRQGLDAFIELGAHLTPEFTAGELRSAYRRLALTYHPDRHPGISETEKARLTRLLADLNEHHRHLMTAVRPAAA